MGRRPTRLAQEIPEPSQRRDGRFEGKIKTGYQGGKPVYRSVYGKDKADYYRRAWEYIGRSTISLAANTDTITFFQWVDQCIEDRLGLVRPTTLRNLRGYRSHIPADIGEMPLVSVRALHIDNVMQKLVKKKLSPSVQKHIFHFLKKILRRAYQLDLIPNNPADKLDPPRGGNVRKSRALSTEEVRRLLAAARGTRWYGPIYLFLSTGLRQGELFALSKQSIRGDQLHVVQTLHGGGLKATFGPPKSEAGKRTIPLSADIISVIQAHCQLIEEERSITATWQESGLLFPSNTGTPMNANNFRRAIRNLRTSAELAHFTVHDLRHTYVTMARRQADPKLLAISVGHSDSKITDSIYNHPSQEDLRKVPTGLVALIGYSQEVDEC